MLVGTKKPLVSGTKINTGSNTTKPVGPSQKIVAPDMLTTTK
jgi:hypothetical protein